MADTDTTNTALVNALSGPRRVTGDAGSVETHSITDLIKADQYLSAKAAGKLRNRGLRFNKLIPPGTVEGHAGQLGGGYGNFGCGPGGGYPQ